MDQPVSIKKFFNICFNSPRFRTKHKTREDSGCCQHNQRNGADPELKNNLTKSSRFHKFIFKNDASSDHEKKKFVNCYFSNDDSKVPGTNPPLNSKHTVKKHFLSCFKKHSSGDEAVKKLPAILTKLNLDTTTQRGFKEENSVVIEAIPPTKTSQTQVPPTHCSHNSAIELMSRDGTLQLYSATTLTPLSSYAIQDEERIQTHLSISCFRPENHARYSSSDGPDDVFEANDETLTSLASNFRSSEHSKSISENCDPRIQRHKKPHMAYNKESGYLVKELISTDESPSFSSNGNEEKIRNYCQNTSKNKRSHVSNHCTCVETVVTSTSHVKQHSFNHPQPPTKEETYEIPSNVPSTNTACQKQHHSAHSAHSCTSVTSHIPREVSPVKKWILQLYFNSLVAADENTYCGCGSTNNIYTKENTNEYASPKFSYAQKKDSRFFVQTALEGQNSLGMPSARISSEINSNAVPHKCRSYIAPAASRKNCPTNKHEDEYFESFKTMSLGQSKKCNDHNYAEKENKLNRSRVKSVPNTVKSQTRTRRHFRDKYRKPDKFSQDTTYTHYPFIDGPLAKNFENVADW